MARAGKDIKSVIIKSRTTLDLREQRSQPQESSTKRSSNVAILSETSPEDLEINSLISTIESQRAALDMRAKGMLSLQSDIMSMGKLLEEEKRRRTSDSAQMQKLMTENGRLRFQISELNNNLSALSKLQSDLEDHIKQLQKDLEAKALLQAKASANAVKSPTLQGELAMLREKESNLLRIIAGQKGELAEKTQQIDEFERQIAVFIQEKADFQAEMRDFQTTKDSLDRETAKNREISSHQCFLESQIAALQSEISRIQLENDHFRVENDSFQHQIDSLTAELFAKSQEILNLIEIEKRMSVSFQSLQNEESSLQSKLKSEVFTSKLLSEKCAALELRLSEQKSVDVIDIRPWEDRVKELQSKLAEQVKAAKQAENRLAIFAREIEEEKLVFSRKLTEIQTKLAEITKSRNESQKKCEELEQIIDSLRENQRKSEDISEIQSEYAQTKELNLRLTRQITDLMQRNEQLQGKVSDSEANTVKIQLEMEKISESLTREQNSLRIKLKANEGSLDDLQSKLNKERMEKKQLQEELNRLISQKAESTAEIESELHEYRAKVAYLEIELSSSKESVEKAAARISQLQGEMETLVGDNKRLQNEVERLGKDLVDVGPMKNRLEEEVGRLRGVEDDLIRGVGLLETAAQSLEGNTTCYTCLELLKDAVMCLPCGHVYCQKCKEKTRNCSECGAGKTVTSVIRVGLIDTISGKVSYSRQVIGSMRQTMERLKGTGSG